MRILNYLFVGLILSSTLSAQEADHGGHKHHLALFLGADTNSDETEFATGLDYEYRLNEHWGVGGILDFAFSSPVHTVVAASVFYHVNQHLKFNLAPGIGFHDAETFFDFGTGVGYDWHFKEVWSIGPMFSFNLATGQKPRYVYGVSLGRGF